MKILKWIIVYIIVAPVFYVMTFPICSLIALMDWGNGKTYRENLREVMGMKPVSYTHLTLPTKA